MLARGEKMILEDIFKKTKQDLELRKKSVSLVELEERAFARNVKDFFAFFSKDTKKIQIIAEVKKASPSKGVIRADFKPLQIALNYEAAGACGISVLTEPHYFQGSLEYLEQIAQKVSLPLLRKDFIFDEYQILEARAFGADFILLIAKMLDKNELKSLYEFAKSLNLEVLFEVHNKEDLDKALFVDANIIGINHRNLNDFTMNMRLCEELIAFMPRDKFIVAESGLDSKKVLLELQEIGVNAFLMGEYFMRQTDEKLALKSLIEQ